MHFFNLYIPNLRAQEYVSSDPIQRATWLNVSAFCCEQENGGRIIGAAKWTERQWMTCGVTKREATHCEPLVTFEGDDAVVWAYPENSEKAAQVKRLNGRRGGLAKAANTSSKTSSVATSIASDLLLAKDESATSIPSTKEKISKEKISKEKISKEKESEHSERGLKFAEWFKDQLPPDIKLSPTWKNKWAKCFDDMMRLDNRTAEEIFAVCKWAREDARFWAKNFLTASKLRECNKDGVQYFDVFAANMASARGVSEPPSPPVKQKTRHDFIKAWETKHNHDYLNYPHDENNKPIPAYVLGEADYKEYLAEQNGK